MVVLVFIRYYSYRLNSTIRVPLTCYLDDQVKSEFSLVLVEEKYVAFVIQTQKIPRMNNSKLETFNWENERYECPSNTLLGQTQTVSIGLSSTATIMRVQPSLQSNLQPK